MTLHQEPAPTPVPAEVNPVLTEEQLKALAGGYEHATNTDQSEAEAAPTRKALKQGEKTPFLTKGRIIAGIATGAVVGIGVPVAVVATTQTAPVAEAPADPTLAPTESSSPAPEASPTTPETQTSFVVNYERFGAEWDAADRDARLAICGEFFANNKPDTSVVPGPNLKGPEIAEWYAAVKKVLFALNVDRSNEENHIVAQKIGGECLTSVHDQAAQGQSLLLEELSVAYQAGFETKPVSIDPDQVTRHSDGIFSAVDYQNLLWSAYTIEGRQNNLGKTLVQQVFEWQDNEAFPSFASAAVLPADTATKYGDIPPVVIDQSRANAPWQG